MYVPFTQTDIAFFQPSEIAVRTLSPPISIAGDLPRAVWSIDPEQPVAVVRTLDDILDPDVADRRRVLSLVAAFSTVALLLAAVGVYGVLSFVVAQTRRDIGVRIAPGARPRAVVNAVLARAAVRTTSGVAAGLAVAAAVARVLSSLLYDVSPLDPRVLAGGSTLVAAIALTASYLPARRAAATDPVAVLRAD